MSLKRAGGIDFILEPQEGSALIVVDVQCDFLPGGALAVPRGDKILGALNHAITIFVSRHLPIIATGDWHPENHISFKERGGPWPPHCIVGTPGARFSKALRLPSRAVVIHKAESPDADAYSGFEKTRLHELLQSSRVNTLYVGGLATDYCVLNTVKDALALGYKVFVLEDSVAAVNVKPDDGKEAIQEMSERGAVAILASELR